MSQSKLQTLLQKDDEYLEQNLVDIIEQLGGIRSLLEAIHNDCKSNNSKPTDGENIKTHTTSATLKTANTSNTNTSTKQPNASVINNLTSQNTWNCNSSIESSISDININTGCKWNEKYSIHVSSMNDTWHKILSDKKRADNISNFLSSKWMSHYILPLIIFITIIYSTMISIYDSFGHYSLYILYKIVACVSLICILLSLNITIFWYQLKTFTTVYKLYNGIVSLLIYFLSLSTGINPGYGIPSIFQFSMIIILLVTHDAWYISKFGKILFVSAATLGFISYLVQTYFNLSVESDVTIKFLGETVILKDVALASLTNLVVFLIAQFYHMIKEPEKATVVSHRPTIVWN